MEAKKVSDNMLARLPVYLNYIKTLPESTTNVSATKIANALGLGEVSVRKDLAKVSKGGRCKLGYPCEELINDIERFLGLKNNMDAIVVGRGELIQSLLRYSGFEHFGLNVVAGFDGKCTRTYGAAGEKIYPLNKMEEFLKKNEVQMGVLMVPAAEAQAVCDQLVACGVPAIWNFTSVHLNVPEEVIVQNESMTVSVTKLRMQMKERKEAV